MPGRRKKPSPLEAQLDAVRSLAAAASTPAARTQLRAALREGVSLVAARAAGIVREQVLDGFAEDLELAFRRFLAGGVENDPGCAAKLAALEALDFGGHEDARVFLDAIRCVQMEPAWGPPVDTAVGVRARGIVALARVEYPELSVVAGDLFADGASPVRQATAEALASTGDGRHAGLLVLRWNLGDEDPLVVMACMSALLSLVPEEALRRLRVALHDDDEATAELAAVALGQSRRPEALEVLLEHLGTASSASARAITLRALGLQRDDRALEALLQVIATGPPGDAAAALAGLGARRFEVGVREKAVAAVRRNPRARLDAALASAFPPSE